MDEKYIKKVLDETADTWPGPKITMSISCPEDLGKAFRESCGNRPYSNVLCKLMADFVAGHKWVRHNGVSNSATNKK